MEIFQNESSITSFTTSICTYNVHTCIKLRHDPTFFDKVKILTESTFNILRHSHHFENVGLQILNIILKIQCVYHFWMISSHTSKCMPYRPYFRSKRKQHKDDCLYKTGLHVLWKICYYDVHLWFFLSKMGHPYVAKCIYQISPRSDHFWQRRHSEERRTPRDISSFTEPFCENHMPLPLLVLEE